MKENIEKIYNESQDKYYSMVNKWLKNGNCKMIITANAEILMKANVDSNINSMFCHEKVSVIPDGILIVKAQKKLKLKFSERITGIDLCNHLLRKANEKKLSVYFFGASGLVIEKLKLIVMEKYPNINILGFSDGYISDKDGKMKEIIKLKPDICLVAMGVPNQEELIFRHLDNCEKGIFVGLGGSFDVISGFKKRAPKLFIMLNLEWLYRIFKEPLRIKRFYENNILFLLGLKKYSKGK